jgi:hypothetical protein
LSIIPERDPWRASLRASRERRAAAFRRRRRRLRGRTGAAVACLSLSVLTGGALAAPAGPTGGAALRSGATGDPVAAVQRALGVAADGIYGPRTRAAVKRFQRRSGLVADGVAGPETRGALGIEPAGSAEAAEAAVPAEAATRESASAPTGETTARLARIAACESGGDPTAVSSDGAFRGKYQFTRETWRAMGGVGDPAAAPEAEQDRRAALLLEREGGSPWPVCSRR